MHEESTRVGRLWVNPMRRHLGWAVTALLFILGHWTAKAQETRPTGDTVLNAAFADKLGDAGLNWPTRDAVIAAQARDVEYARYDACRWQRVVIAKPARVKRCDAEWQGRMLTPGVSANGYDSVYYRWEIERYRLQSC